MIEIIKNNRSALIRFAKYAAIVWAVIAIIMAVINYIIEQVYNFERYEWWYFILYWIEGNLVSFMVIIFNKMK